MSFDVPLLLLFSPIRIIRLGRPSSKNSGESVGNGVKCRLFSHSFHTASRIRSSLPTPCPANEGSQEMRLKPLLLHAGIRQWAAAVILVLAGASLLRSPDQERQHPGARIRPHPGRRSRRHRDRHRPGTRRGAQERFFPPRRVRSQLPHAGALHAAFRGGGLSPLRGSELRGPGGRDGGLFTGADPGRGHSEHRGFGRGRAPGDRHSSDGHRPTISTPSASRTSPSTAGTTWTWRC